MVIKMILAVRKEIEEDLKNIDKSKWAHPGLILQRYLVEQKNDTNSSTNERDELFTRILKAQNNAQEVYRMAYKRWEKSFAKETISVSGSYFSTLGRLVCGLGSDSPIETGITLHHTYGMPFIPGSSLKGIASSYCKEYLGKEDPRFGKDGEYFNIIFGSNESAGHIIFHDAWLKPGSGFLEKDIMTPHHEDYYTQKGKKDAAPTDFDSPVPVPFLSVSANTTFLVIVSCYDSSENGKKWTDLALEILEKALLELCVGGKTRSGYGQMEKGAGWNPPQPPKHDPYTKGEIIEVTRIKDNGRKERMEFEADNKTLCFFRKGTEPEEAPVPVGGKTKVKIDTVETSPPRFILTLP